MNNNQFSLLEQINLPADLRRLERQQLPQLAQQLREFLLESLSKTGGHLASNLGSIELTIALHYIYNTPEDLLVWDVGHQTYAHKILTKRRQAMEHLRQFGGIAGFPKRDESIYDTFGTGHSSTSISAALGMAIANKHYGKNNKTVAIIGDGAMSAGLAFEGLNNAGWSESDILVILNDNEMSISESVGAISHYLTKMLASNFYNKVKQTAINAFENMPNMRKIAHKVEEHVKGLLMPCTLFEELGFNYIGPIDGHNLDTLLDTLTNIKALSGPQFLHIVTKKGYGYKLAENNPITYHGVSKFSPQDGLISNPSSNKPLSYSEIFGTWLLDLAARENDFMAITPAMREGSGMVEFAKAHPTKFVDVGIAEQHALVFAAGLATQNIKPIVAIYSTFLQRAYDQLIHDIALQNLPVMFAVDRSGIVGPDGPTHSGAYDLSFLRCIPNMVIMAPADENQCYQMLWAAYNLNAPCVVRYPRGGAGSSLNKEVTPIPLGKGLLRRQGQRIAIFSFGPMLANALNVAEKLNATVCDMRFVKPLDLELLAAVATTHDYLVTVEENVVSGGAGSACNEALLKRNIVKPILNLGLPDTFIVHGDPKILFKLYHLDEEGILIAIQQWLEAVISETSNACRSNLFSK